MRILIAALLAGLPVMAQTYTINTVAGGLPAGFSPGPGDGGPATLAALAIPLNDVASDGFGNIYIASGNLVRKVSPAGIISTIAGGGDSVSDFVPATQAAIAPAALASAANGTLYLADTAFGVSRIRRIDLTGVITTVAGGSCCDQGDGGQAISAYLGNVLGLALDVSGNLYIAENLLGSGLIRKVANNGIITTVAGGGPCCAPGEGALATSVNLFSPSGIAVDYTGNLFIAEFGGNRIREVSGGAIHTVAGNGDPQDSGDGGPAARSGVSNPWHIAIDSGITGGDILITEPAASRVRRIAADGVITTVSGNGSDGFSGDGGSAASAQVGAPMGIASAGNGVFYLADSWDQVGRARSLTPSAIRPIVGPGGVVPVFSDSSVIQSGSWVSIYGTNLAASTTIWNGDFPASLGNTSVTVDGKPAYLWFVSPGQINFQVPDDSTVGSVKITVTTLAGSFTANVTLAPYAPSFSLLNNKYPAAIVATPGFPGNSGNGYDLIGPSGAFAFTTRPVRAGETLVLYGVGFGPTNPPVPSGRLFSGAAPSGITPQVTIGGVPAPVTFAGIVQAGLFQLNVQVPNVPGGDQPLLATVGSASTPPNVLVTVK